ncbi:MAG: hypothetical protein U9N54_11635, partial [candidate division Zixibacteria bacterium]|nr:hypothetical protein [candidate division Zixibacteria bacterium]
NKNDNDQPVANISKELQPIKDRKNIIEWSKNNMIALFNQSANFIDKPATQRMIEKNIRYVSNLSGNAWDKVWNTEEGKESIEHALSEALYHAATLPEMGSIVPFGSGCEFIPSIECFKFGLESGKNAPFKDINILLIHENDQTELSQENGNFKIKLKYGIPRGEIIAVAVHATRTDTDTVIGEVYDVSRLMDKAFTHSPSYKNYILEKEDFENMRIEGKLKKDNSGREFYINPIKKKDGTTWNKKIYAHDLTNPYDGADRPEMLKKSAGKSFFRPYMKTRNAVAMATEWTDEEIENEKTLDETADIVLDQASRQFENVENIKDAEIVEKDKDLFDGEVDEL